MTTTSLFCLAVEEDRFCHPIYRIAQGDNMSKVFNINYLSGCWPHYHFMGCPKCSISLAPFAISNPACPQCGKRMRVFKVTQEEFDAWLKRRAVMNYGKMPEPDINDLMRRAENEISYKAKRAIEMYWPVWEKEPAFYLFLKCAENNALCQGEIDKCRFLMQEYGMVEEGA